MFDLVPHPDFPSHAVTQITAVARRWRYVGERLHLGFLVRGDIISISMPGLKSGHADLRTAGRIDGLWQHSCFEAFGAMAFERSYFELNFATSGDWAAYEFDDRRLGMRQAENLATGGFSWKVRPQRVLMQALIDMPSTYECKDWHLGLSAVIEAKDGTKSYWALAHAPGPPDFHNADCFIATLPAPAAP